MDDDWGSPMTSETSIWRFKQRMWREWCEIPSDISLNIMECHGMSKDVRPLKGICLVQSAQIIWKMWKRCNWDDDLNVLPSYSCEVSCPISFNSIKIIKSLFMFVTSLQNMCVHCVNHTFAGKIYEQSCDGGSNLLSTWVHSRWYCFWGNSHYFFNLFYIPLFCLLTLWDPHI